MYISDKFCDKKVLKSTLIQDENITAFFTTRELALKSGEREDLISEVENNKKLVCVGLNIPEENLIIPQQTHSSNVKVIKADASIDLKDTDALITDEKNIAIALNFADCVPIIFYDKETQSIGIAHAGWRGTVGKIGIKTVREMEKSFGAKPENITALIGPSIGKCCFEVKEEVLKKLQETIPDLAQNEEIFSNFHADLKLVNRHQLLSIGVKKIDVCEYCTSCRNELFFSYRKEKGYTARHSAVIMIKPKNGEEK